MARLAIAKQPAARVSSPKDLAPGSPPWSSPVSSPGTGTRSQPGTPAWSDREGSRPTLESEFMQAMQDYKKKSGRMFPTWSEVLEVLQSLGYRKAEPETTATPVGLEAV